MYTYARFFTMTGWHVADTPLTTLDRAEALQTFHRAIFGAARAPQTPPPSGLVTLEDTALLSKAQAAKNGARFAALYAGDQTGYHSPSEADMSLCVRLAFWSQGPAQIDRLFRQSGLMRDKWDEKRGAQTYGARTIAEALARQTEHYQRGAASPVVGRAANIGRYRRQIYADPYFGAPCRRGTGITPAVLVTEQEMIHD